MRVFVAALMFLAIAAVGIGMLRGLGRTGPGGRPRPTAVEEADPNVRVTFWCENCFTEVLLLRKGSEQPPRHCGEPMIRREEVPRAL